MTTLRDLVKAQGLTGEQVADRAGVSRPTLYAMYHKNPGCSIANVKAVCDVVGISLDTYMNDLEPCPHSQRYIQLEQEEEDDS